jgi:hypothetical protein
MQFFFFSKSLMYMVLNSHPPSTLLKREVVSFDLELFDIYSDFQLDLDLIESNLLSCKFYLIIIKN